jgi:hypothetical protein
MPGRTATTTSSSSSAGDADYDGKVFNITLSDVPERKTNLVEGRYEIPTGKVGQTIAVKIIDMLGEEVLTTLQP